MSDITEEKSPENGENLQIVPEERPIAEASFSINAASQKLLQRKLFLSSVIAIVMGSVLVLAYIVLSVLGGETVAGSSFSVPAALPYALLLLGALPLGCGIVFLFLARRNVSIAARTNAENHYGFYGEYVLISVTRSGEDMGDVKCRYDSLYKVRENKAYFLLYPTATTVYPVSKSDLGPACDSLRAVLPMKK